MVHSNNGERQKCKPRGRPFPPGNKRGKPSREILDDSRHNTSSEREDVKDREIKDSNCMEKDISDFEKKFNELAYTLIDSLDFENGKDKISVKFLKKGNNSFRIQIFLNGKHEVRPTTYNGSRMAFAYWDLLKGTLEEKKNGA